MKQHRSVMLTLLSEIIGVWKESLCLYLCIVALLFFATEYFNLDTAFIRELASMPPYLFLLVLSIIHKVILFTKEDIRREAQIKESGQPSTEWRSLSYVFYIITITMPLLFEYMFWKFSFPFVPHLFVIAWLIIVCSVILALTKKKTVDTYPPS